jgi:DedD protein
MNPELKQRLIGAAVVTALATIFIPMLFDDPVDNSGQSVSELTIPAAPIKSAEVSANKLPTPANKNIKPQEPSDTEEDPAEPVVGNEMVDDADAEASEATASRTTPQTASDPAIEAEPIDEGAPLDTGVVAEAKTPAKKPTKLVEPDVEVKIKPPIKKIDANAPKLLPTKKPVEDVAIVKQPPVATPIKKVEDNKTKPIPVTKPTTVATVAEKPAKSPELVRWTIHAGSFGQKENASTLMKSLREQGIPVSIETIQSGSKPIYRLKIGPELDKKKAAANKAKLDKQGVGNVMIAE